MGNNLETIHMEGQGHIFTIDLIFLGQHAMPRGPAFSERYFINVGESWYFRAQGLGPDHTNHSKDCQREPPYEISLYHYVNSMVTVIMTVGGI